MEDALVEILSAAILLAVIVHVAGTYFLNQHPTTPSLPPAGVTGTITLSCSTQTVSSGGLHITIPQTYTARLTLSVMNLIDDNVRVLGVKVYGSEKAVPINRTLTPRAHTTIDVPLPLATLTTTAKAKPGDTFYFKPGEGLVKTGSGVIMEEYLPVDELTLPPVCPFTPAYNIPMTGGGDTMSLHVPPTGGCNGTKLGAMPEMDSLLVLAHAQGVENQSTDDIPLFMYIYNSTTGRVDGFYIRTPNIIGVVNTGTETSGPINVTEGVYIAMLVDEGAGVTSLLLDNSSTPITIPSAVTGGYLYAGLQRVEQHIRNFRLTFILYTTINQTQGGGGGGWPIPQGVEPLGTGYSYSQWLGNTTYYLHVTYSGAPSPTPREWGYGMFDGDFYTPSSWDRALVRAIDAPLGQPPYVWVYEVNPAGPSPYDSQGRYHGVDVLDYVFDWNDTDGASADMKVRVTLFADGYIRLENILLNIPPANYLFIAEDDNYPPSNDMDGDYLPDNWHLIKVLDFQGPSVWWVDASPVVGKLSDNLTTKLDYVGVYANDTLNITGLQPGDTILLTAAGKSVAVNVTSPRVLIHLLDYFTPEELVEAITKEGGIGVAIQESESHIIEQVPTKVLVHVATDSYDYWEEVYSPIVTRCNASVATTEFLDSPVTLRLWTPDWAYWYVQVEDIQVGTYLSGLLRLMNGTARILTLTGVVDVEGPVNIYFGDEEGILIVDTGHQTIRRVEKVYAMEVEARYFILDLKMGK